MQATRSSSRMRAAFVRYSIRSRKNATAKSGEMLNEEGTEPQSLLAVVVYEKANPRAVVCAASSANGAATAFAKTRVRAVLRP